MFRLLLQPLKQQLAIFKVDYLREYESIFETASAHESVDPGVLFDEKNQRSKISCYCPFNNAKNPLFLVKPNTIHISSGFERAETLSPSQKQTLKREKVTKIVKR
jgi:hypothetical protein